MTRLARSRRRPSLLAAAARLASLLGCVSLLAPACESRPASSPARVLRLVTSNAGGVDYQELTDEYSRSVPAIEFRRYDTTNSQDALLALQRSDADVGFIMADMSYLAYAGRLEGHTGSLDRLRAVFVSGVLPVYLVAREHSGIRSARDLRGRTVAVGLPGGAVERIALAALRAFGIPKTSITTAEVPSMRAVEEIRKGTIDAMFTMGGFPGATPAESVRAALAVGARLVPLDGAEADRLRERNRYVRALTIPAETYPGQKDAVATIGIQNLLICRSDLEEQLVYELTKGLFDVIPRSAPLANAFRFMDLDQAAATSIPLHEGAARYFRERDLFQ